MDISVIIPKSREGDLTKEWCLRQLGGFNHEVFLTKSWQDGLKKAKGEFICLLEKDCVLGPNYFTSLMDVFKERPSFRKLAMVAPAVGVNNWDKKVYGFQLFKSNASPITLKPSSDPHFVQIAYLPGALIRRSAISSISMLGRDIMLDSFNLSSYFWSNGKMVILHPGVTYVSTDDELDMNYHLNEPANYDEILSMFKREMIGADE